MKSHLTLLFVFLSLFLSAQFSYEPNLENPYGLPNPEAPKEILDFAPLIGECRCKSEKRNPDQTWAEPEDMIWRFKYIMNGTAIQDETLKEDGSHSGSIRQFIPDSTKWYVHYYNSSAPTTTLPTWEGSKKEDGTIVLYRDQKAPNGMDGFYRLTFYDVKSNGFKWVGEWVDKTESVVFPSWKIDCSNGKVTSGNESDKAKIQLAVQNFSKAYIAKDYETMAQSYTKDGKIFPNNLQIISGRDTIKKWWEDGSGSDVLSHRIVPEEITFIGDNAYDFGYYSGSSKNKEGELSEWKGKYVVVWKKEDGNWKMYLDIWNRVSD
ncbi:MAG: DUF4440 domain-containing protein [Bacteroidota bacterium]